MIDASPHSIAARFKSWMHEMIIKHGKPGRVHLAGQRIVVAFPKRGLVKEFY